MQFIVNGEENPQNCPLSLGFRHPAGGRPIYGLMQYAQKIGKYRVCDSRYMLAHGHLDGHTHTHTQTCLLQYFAAEYV